MASKPRKKGSKWEFVVKRAGLLEKPLYLLFDTVEEGETYCANLERLLDKGIVPTEVQPREVVVTLGGIVRQYIVNAHPSQKDRDILGKVLTDKGDTKMLAVDVDWVDHWITEMKRADKLAPGTIRGKVGAVARACDWAIRKKLIVLPDQPFRTLPEGYAGYTSLDAALAGVVRKDIERDRRLEGDEEKRIRAVITAGVLPRKQRPRLIEDPASFLVDFDLALETGMRLRERYTIEAKQIRLDLRTIHLDRTKNGDSREVPLSSVALRVVREQMERREGESYLFPWYKGDDSVYGMKMMSNYLSKFYAEIFDAAGCSDLREHDLRHEATSRFFERTSLSVESVMKLTGHRTHKMVMRYLKLRGSSLADQLW